MPCASPSYGYAEQMGLRLYNRRTLIFAVNVPFICRSFASRPQDPPLSSLPQSLDPSLSAAPPLLSTADGVEEAAFQPRSERIGNILVARGKLELPNLDRALKVQDVARAESGSTEKLGSVLSRLGMISGRDLAEGLAQQRGWHLALCLHQCLDRIEHTFRDRKGDV